MQREALGHHRAEFGRGHQLARDQPLGKVVAQCLFRNPLLLEHLAEGGVAERSVGPAEARDFGDFAVDQPVAGDDAVRAPESGGADPVDQLVEHLFQPALGDEGLHGEARVFALEVFQRGGGRLAELGGADLFLADRRDAVAAAARPALEVGDIAGGESQSNQPEEQQSEHNAELRANQLAHKLDHGRFTCDSAAGRSAAAGEGL